MKTASILYLASKSHSRRMLLDVAKIPYTILAQDADELACDWKLPLHNVVLSIALHKMNHVELPAGIEGQVCYVLTADTLVEDADGNICGKPVDYKDAVSMIKNARNGSQVATAFCIDKKIWNNGAWSLQERITKVVDARYCIKIPDESIEDYFSHSPGIECAGGCSIEDYGAQFLQWVDGSYSTIIGLPLYEVRSALVHLGFFE